MTATRFHVGQRVWNDYHREPATVTAITSRGFRWRLDKPRSLGPRHGWYQEGESFTDEGWTLAQPANTDSVPGSPSRSGAQPDQPKLPESGGIGVSSIGLGAEGEQ